MANLGTTFDASTVQPSAPMDTVPPGDYIAQIVNSEMRETKDGHGRYLWLELSIMDGPQSNRRVFDRLNLVNANETAARIAQESLSAICHATGQMQVSDSEQLHHKSMKITVKVRPAGPDKNGTMRDAQNEVKGYAPATGGVSSAPRAAAPAAPAKPAAAASAPWRRTAA